MCIFGVCEGESASAQLPHVEVSAQHWGVHFFLLWVSGVKVRLLGLKTKCFYLPSQQACVAIFLQGRYARVANADGRCWLGLLFF